MLPTKVQANIENILKKKLPVWDEEIKTTIYNKK
jgi:hypothetical protein